jgi:hypothetical protein
MFAVCAGASAGSAWAVGACPNEGFREVQHATALADCRAYELVSPSAKNGSDVVPDSFKVFSAADGNGVAFPALGGFGDVRGTSTDVQYVSRRAGGQGTSGWATHAINPPGGAPTLLALFFGNVPTFEAAFTPDLTGAVFKSWKPLTVAPNVAGVSNLYRLRDLDGSESQAQLLSAAVVPLVPSDPFSKLQVLNTFAAASRDLSHVMFQSPWNLTGDGGFLGAGNLYEYADGGGVRLVGRIPSGSDTECDDAGAPACVDAASADAGLAVSTFGSGLSLYSTGMMSADGSRILFQVPAGSDGAIYMREDGVRTYQLNASERTPPDPPGTLGPAQVWGMSDDGSRVFFTTGDSLIDADNDGGSADLYVYDVTAPAGSRLTLLSQDNSGGASVTSVVGSSADGHYVYFVADDQLVAGEPTPVLQGLYMWHDGVIRYIGQFKDFNEAHVNTPNTGWAAPGSARNSRVTPDGRHLLFMQSLEDGFRGRGGYAGFDHGTCNSGKPCREWYLYSADSGSLSCVTCNTRSGVATGESALDVVPGVSASLATMHLSHALSDDGQHVFFSTPQALVAGDANGKWDAYEYDTADGSVHLLSSGTSASDSYFMDASPDGRDAFFVTRDRLVGWDVDDSYDLYDARVGGGFPEPPLSSSVSCSGDECQGPPSGVPAFSGPGSALFAGSGNVAPPVVKRLASAKKLSTALRVCKKKKRVQRKRCESQARKRYAKKASNSASRRSK